MSEVKNQAAWNLAVRVIDEELANPSNYARTVPLPTIRQRVPAAMQVDVMTEVARAIQEGRLLLAGEWPMGSVRLP